MRYDDYRQLKLELEYIQKSLQPSFVKAFVKAGWNVRKNKEFCNDVRNQYDYQVNNMLKKYYLNDISVYRKFDEIWDSIWDKYEEPSAAGKILRFALCSNSILGTALQAYDAKEEIQKSLDEYFDKTKEYCLNKVLEHVDDNE